MDWGFAKVLARGRIPSEPAEDQLGTGLPDIGPESNGSTYPETQHGSVIGTPAYMAPEQANGQIGELDERTDVFGLGAILCEILTGSPPYSGDRYTVLRAAAGGEPGRCRDPAWRSSGPGAGRDRDAMPRAGEGGAIRECRGPGRRDRAVHGVARGTDSEGARRRRRAIATRARRRRRAIATRARRRRCAAPQRAQPSADHPGRRSRNCDRPAHRPPMEGGTGGIRQAIRQAEGVGGGRIGQGPRSRARGRSRRGFGRARRPGGHAWERSAARGRRGGGKGPPRGCEPRDGGEAGRRGGGAGGSRLVRGPRASREDAFLSYSMFRDEDTIRWASDVARKSRLALEAAGYREGDERWDRPARAGRTLAAEERNRSAPASWPSS